MLESAAALRLPKLLHASQEWIAPVQRDRSCQSNRAVDFQGQHSGLARPRSHSGPAYENQPTTSMLLSLDRFDVRSQVGDAHVRHGLTPAVEAPEQIAPDWHISG